MTSPLPEKLTSRNGRWEVHQPRPEGSTCVGRFSRLDDALTHSWATPNGEVFDRVTRTWLAPDPEDFAREEHGDDPWRALEQIAEVVRREALEGPAE